ncbi:UNVERIFIED_ORG: hypothetical protein FHR35_009112 [Microbispora rosea subsp. rosea]
MIITIACAATGIAVASQSTDPTMEQTCAALYGQGSDVYKECMEFNGLVPPDAGGTPTAAAARAGNHPVIYWCSNKSTGSTPPARSCKTPIVCTWQADSKYHCVNSNGVEVAPSATMCASNPDYACYTGVSPTNTGSAQNLVATLGPAAPETALAAPTALVASPTPTPASISPSSQPTTTPTPSPSPTPTPTPAVPADDPVGQAITQARDAYGLRIWLETDLVPKWQAGPDQLQAAAARIATYASQPNVVGVQIAYDLGLRNPTNGDDIQRFVSETSAALRQVLPPGRQIAVNVDIPELGCGTNQTCVEDMRRRYPALTLAQVERAVLNGAVDAVNVTSGLWSADYAKWGINAAAAERNLWLRLKLRTWEVRVPGLYVGARQLALAHAGARSPLSKAAAEDAVRTRVDLPLQRGIHHVVLWTWRQTWNGDAWRLADQDVTRNQVWDALRVRKGLKRVGIVYNPREPERGLSDDLKAIADVATEIYLFLP